VRAVSARFQLWPHRVKLMSAMLDAGVPRDKRKTFARDLLEQNNSARCRFNESALR
jgi:hypothetical protein